MKNVRYFTDGSNIWCETDPLIPVKGTWEIDGWTAMEVQDQRKALRPVEDTTRGLIPDPVWAESVISS